MLPDNSGQRLVAAHEIILDAIERKDARASEWMAKHIIDFKRGYQLAGLDVNAPVPWSG